LLPDAVDPPPDALAVTEPPPEPPPPHDAQLPAIISHAQDRRT
jgi:hypothetical protein